MPPRCGWCTFMTSGPTWLSQADRPGVLIDGMMEESRKEEATSVVVSMSQSSACTEIGPLLTTVGGTQMSLIGTWQTKCLRPSVGLASSVDERPLIDPGLEG